MPSQLSTGPSAAASQQSYSLQVDKTGGRRADNNGVHAAARAVKEGLAGSCNKISEAMGTTVKEVGEISNMAHKLCNGDSLAEEEKVPAHNGHHVLEVCNGVLAMPPNFSCPKTRGSHSNEGGSLTGHCDEGRLVCPQDALQQANDLVSSRIDELLAKQKDLATWFASLEVDIQKRQMKWMSRHISGQIGEMEEDKPPEEGPKEEGSEFNGSVSQWTFPIQVDGACDDTFLPRESVAEMEVVHDEVGTEGDVSSNCAPTKSRCEDSFSSIDSFASASSVASSYIGSEGDAPSRRRSERVLKAHATSISALLDDDVTDSSSDEEETTAQDSVEQSKRSFLKHSWSMSRVMVGSRWLWLQRKIAELNKQIYLLDHHVKGLYRQDNCTFGSTPSSSSSSLLTHPYFPFSNGSTLEKLRAVGNALGATSAGVNSHPLLPLAKAAALTSKHAAMANGFTATPTSQGHRSYLPHLLLPEALLSGGRLQVKELLSPSPLGQNLLCLDEGTCARSRPLLKRSGCRKVVRRPRSSGRIRGVSLDPSRHSHLSMPHELPSRLILDSVMRDALTDHSYARLPLNKRRRAASSLPLLATPTVSVDTVLSTSPSPSHTPYSLESSRGGQSRKKSCSLQQQASYESISTASTLGNGGSPWSPGISRPPTPNSTPQGSSARKKKMSHSTPLFDIDNIVIPYSIASSTRLEKLEYKEIITPRWREVERMGEMNNSDEKCSETRAESEPVEEEEDLTDEVFMKRHNRSEMSEKKRFLNFISGSNHRRRVRPHSVTLSESPSCPSANDSNLTSPPLRRVTVTSPIPLELEACRLPDVLPWQPRKFPLGDEDEQALHDPPPPPPPTFLSSPIKHLQTSTPSRSPSCSTSAYNTPLGSPPATPIDDAPSHSPAEWVVNSHFNTGHSLPGLHQLPTVLTSPSSSPAHLFPQQHQPIILKLTKKT